MALYRRAVFVFAVVMIVLGIALLARTASVGGGTVGYVIGALFVALGAARLTMLRKT